MSCKVIVPAVLAGLGAATLHAAPVDFLIDSQGVSVDQKDKTATFTLTFNRAPDFSADQSNQQPDAFQYELDTAWNGQGPADLNFNHIDAVIRGSEIWEGSGLPIRAAQGNGGLNSGGWGPVRDFVPYQLSGETVTFKTTLDDLGDSDGRFRYQVFSTQNGAMTSISTGAVIPLPPAIWTGISMMGGMGFLRKIRRKKSGATSSGLS